MLKRDFLRTCLALAALPAAGCVSRSQSLALPDEAPSAQDAKTLWSRMFRRLPPELSVLTADPRYRVQIVYAPLRHDDDGQLHVEDVFTWQLDNEHWFPAMSLVKLPMALLVAETLSAYHVGFDSRLELDRRPVNGEWPDGEPDRELVARSLRRMLVASDNAPFNRFYDFIGPEALNSRLAAMGYANARIISRLGVEPGRDQRSTVSGSLLSGSGRPVLRWPARTSPVLTVGLEHTTLGTAWVDAKGHQQNTPMDFAGANYLPLQDAFDMLRALLYPEQTPPRRRWAINASLRAQLIEMLGLTPRESIDPQFPAAQFPDSGNAYFVTGDSGTRERAPKLTLTGKNGMAYGYVGDVRYLHDSEARAQCLLAAVIYCNADGVINDDQYEVESIGIPFLAALGRAALAVSREL